MPSLYLLRHGEPAITGVLLGQSDPPLSAEGLKQAESVVLPRVRAIYSSPLLRARQTAGDGCVVVPDLQEISYGLWDGRTWDEIEKEWPDIASRKLTDWFGITPPGGELWTHFEQRVMTAYREIAAGPLPALIVAHEAVHALIAAELTGTNPQDFKQGYCELVELQITHRTDPVQA